jgi:hypothetical protein
MAWEPEVPAGLDAHTTLNADEGGGAPAEEPRAPGMDEGEDARAVRIAPRAISRRLALLALNVGLFVACVALAGSVVLWPPVATPHQQLPPAQTPASTLTTSATDDGQEQPGAPSSRATASSTATGGRARRTPTPVKAPTNTALPTSPTATATTAPPTATSIPPTATPGSGG